MKGKHVVVTGASSGIGEALVREFSGAGARVTLVARRRELLEQIAAQLAGETQLCQADLGDPERAADWLAGAEAAFGPVDVLINNAGVQIVRPTAGSDPAAGEALMRLNVHTPMRLILRVLPSMLERRAGTIVNVSSMAGIAPALGMFYYNAAKAAIGAASESLRGELRRTGVNVVTVYPGPVTTPMETAAREKFGNSAAVANVPTGNAPQLARRVRRAVERKRGRIIYPRIYAMARWFPWLTRPLMDRFSPLPEADRS